MVRTPGGGLRHAGVTRRRGCGGTPPEHGLGASPRLNTVFEPITVAPGTREYELTANLHGVLAQREQPALPHRVTYTIDVTDVADLVKLRFAGVATDIVSASAA